MTRVKGHKVQGRDTWYWLAMPAEKRGAGERGGAKGEGRGAPFPPTTGAAERAVRMGLALTFRETETGAGGGHA